MNHAIKSFPSQFYKPPVSKKNRDRSETQIFNMERYRTLSKMLKTQAKTNSSNSRELPHNQYSSSKANKKNNNLFSLYDSVSNEKPHDLQKVLKSKNKKTQFKEDSANNLKNSLPLSSHDPNSFMTEKNNQDELENIMKSSLFLKPDKNSIIEQSINESSYRILPPHSYTKSPQRNSYRSKQNFQKINSKISKKTMLKNKSLSKIEIEGVSKSKLNKQKSIDLYNQSSFHSSQQNYDFEDQLNIYQTAFKTYNKDYSGKKNRNTNRKNNFKNEKVIKPKKYTSRLKSNEKIIAKSPSKNISIKQKPKSRSIEPKKQKTNNNKKKSKEKTNIFMKSRSRSMSSASDVSANRSKSLNKTNSELRKSGSFLHEDHHINKVIHGYKIYKFIGEGSYAKVYKALHMNTKTPVAIKGIFYLFY